MLSDIIIFMKQAVPSGHISIIIFMKQAVPIGHISSAKLLILFIVLIKVVGLSYFNCYECYVNKILLLYKEIIVSLKKCNCLNAI